MVTYGISYSSTVDDLAIPDNFSIYSVFFNNIEHVVSARCVVLDYSINTFIYRSKMADCHDRTYTYV